MKVFHALLGKATFDLFHRSRSDIVPTKIDVLRYMGTWRVIACTDNPVEKKFCDATESYALVGPNTLEVVFKWREGSFEAPLQTHEFEGVILKDPSRGQWKMKLFPLFSARYIIAEIAPDYSWAVAAHPSKRFGWLLARSVTVADEVWKRTFDRFAALGYDTTKFIKVPQPKSPG